MSAPESIVQAQMEALLRRVAREQETLSRRARDAAEEQSRTIVARAREEARARMRQAAGEARLSVERALADRRAALDTAARQFLREWLFLELRGGGGWLREELEEPREFVPEAAVVLEMSFGRHPRERASAPDEDD